jgi:hypothetical protein
MENDDKPMDEFEWEEFMKRSDELADKYARLVELYGDDPNFEEILAREMGWNKTDSEAEEEDFYPEELEDENEGEEWKESAGIVPNNNPYDEIEKSPLYKKTFLHASMVTQLVAQLPETLQENPFVDSLVTNAIVAGAKIAGGILPSDDTENLDLIGMSIANCKRALNASNTSLQSLQELSGKNIFDQIAYQTLLEEATDVRNAIALYIVELRDLLPPH